MSNTRSIKVGKLMKADEALVIAYALERKKEFFTKKEIERLDNVIERYQNYVKYDLRIGSASQAFLFDLMSKAGLSIEQ